MPKFYSARAIVNALKRAGFSITSQRGSHIKLTKRLKQKTLTPIVPNHKEVVLGTFRSILLQAEMTEEEFKKWVK